MLINQFVPPTFCINFWGMLHDVCDVAYDVAYDENMSGPNNLQMLEPKLINYM